MSAETITEQLFDQNIHLAIKRILPVDRQGCSFAEMQIDQLDWTVALGRLTAERAAELVLERTGCQAGVTVTRLIVQISENSNFQV